MYCILTIKEHHVRQKPCLLLIPFWWNSHTKKLILFHFIPVVKNRLVTFQCHKRGLCLLWNWTQSCCCRLKRFQRKLNYKMKLLFFFLYLYIWASFSIWIVFRRNQCKFVFNRKDINLTRLIYLKKTNLN